MATKSCPFVQASVTLAKIPSALGSLRNADPPTRRPILLLIVT
jgi:hypothetical protein